MAIKIRLSFCIRHFFEFVISTAGFAASTVVVSPFGVRFRKPDSEFVSYVWGLKLCPSRTFVIISEALFGLC